MEVILCTCDDLPAHTHVPSRYVIRGVVYRLDEEGSTEEEELIYRLPAHVVDANPERSWDIIGFEEESIRVAIDWKAVARELMGGPHCAT